MLLTLQEMFPRATTVMVANTARIDMGICRAGDVVYAQRDGRRLFGDVFVHVSVDDESWPVVSEWEQLAPLDALRGQGRMRDAPVLLNTSALQTCLIYCEDGGFATVLIPPQFR